MLHSARLFLSPIYPLSPSLSYPLCVRFFCLCLRLCCMLHAACCLLPAACCNCRRVLQFKSVPLYPYPCIPSPDFDSLACSSSCSCPSFIYHINHMPADGTERHFYIYLLKVFTAHPGALSSPALKQIICENFKAFSGSC